MHLKHKDTERQIKVWTEMCREESEDGNRNNRQSNIQCKSHKTCFFYIDKSITENESHRLHATEKNGTETKLKLFSYKRNGLNRDVRG